MKLMAEVITELDGQGDYAQAMAGEEDPKDVLVGPFKREELDTMIEALGEALIRKFG
jgi:hypothetical protein